MNILVTGGCGFIGTHSVQLLAQQGHTVRVLDESAPDPAQLLTNVQYVQGDVRNAQDIRQAMRDCDAVLHLVALVSVPQSLIEPYTSFEVNTLGTVNVLEAARVALTTGIAKQMRVVFASTAAIFGNVPGLKDETSLTAPLVPYAATKLMAEQAAQNYARCYGHLGLQIARLRYFNVYGPGQKADSTYSGVLTRFISALHTQSPIVLHGDGEQTRDFVHVRDVALANSLMLTLPWSALESVDECAPLYVVATGHSVSLNTILQTLSNIMGSPIAQKTLQPERIGDIRFSAANSARLKSLGWQPQVSLQQGLAELLNVK